MNFKKRSPVVLLLLAAIILLLPQYSNGGLASFGGGLYGGRPLGFSAEIDFHFLPAGSQQYDSASTKIKLVSYRTLSVEGGSDASKLGFGITKANVDQVRHIRPFSYNYELASIYSYAKKDVYVGGDVKICFLVFSLKLGFANKVNHDFDQLFFGGLGFGI